MPIMCDGLPEILRFPGTEWSSISMTRAIKQAIEVILEADTSGKELTDKEQATLDDLKCMLYAIGKPLNTTDV